jgi:hypothetical protein
MKYNCIACGKEFNAKPSAKRKYCSRECALNSGLYKAGNKPTVCKHGVLGKKNCKECQKEYFKNYGRKWRQENHDRFLTRLRTWQQDNRDKTRGYSHKYYWLNREKEIIRKTRGNLKRYHQYRLDALIRYGGDPPKCACCGELAIPFLTIDHINGGGNTHRKTLKNKYKWGIYEYLKRENYPEGFRILCMNCNTSLGHYGYCPHQDGYEYKGVRYEPIKIEEIRDTI